MSNVFAATLRVPCLGIRASRSTVSQVRGLCSEVQSCYGSSRLGAQLRAWTTRSPSQQTHSALPRSSPLRSNRQSFHSSPSQPAWIRSSSNRSSQSAKPAAAKMEVGVTFQTRNLSQTEISQIFGLTRMSARMGNRVLKVLHGRRLAGTLDLDLPQDVRKATTQIAIDKGLEWLRQNHPLDEDAAILQRIEREEQEEEERLIRRAEELGIYKPQSGHFGAEIAKEGDVYGRSVLQEVRKVNEEENKRKEEIERQEWLESEAKEKEVLQKQIKKDTSLQKFEQTAIAEARPRADPEARPALAWIQRHHVRATATLDPSKLTKTKRLLPSLIVVLLTAGASYIFSETYTAPAHHERIWPNVPPTAATLMSLIGTNVLILGLWRLVPPAWRLLNRYFISVPMFPYSISMVGSMFSHQQVRHLATNMVILWFMGSRLHEEVGRGDFLSLFVASGAIASFTSLSAHVLGNNLTITSLGASGAIAGIVGAWCMLHKDDKLTFPLLPADWQQSLSANGSTFLAVIVAIEVLSLVSPIRIGAMDHWAHLGGYATGAVVGWLWRERKEKERKKRRSEEGFWGRLSGGG
ncbi:hypothetical protein AJ80_04213 [Polytolypa hystricis UAMH7299]|uniref:Peptidase S54 rhomboid domain-containing protein n=1 Tax=Polytolypa hystricis (strain UAMH7299) TaxID=1447883 RepID=A0A2B7YCZ1_POLH7|nr:hypothetical protein AJ80_04213 [Polytolypa hystricis UAMH7299]